jgi:hypothetical protein
MFFSQQLLACKTYAEHLITFLVQESLGGTLPPLPPLGELFKNRTAVVLNSPDCANAPPPSGLEDCVGTSVYCSRSGE